MLAVHAWTQVFYLQVDTRRHPHLPRSPLLDAQPDWRVTDRAGRASDHNGGGHVFGDPANPRLRAFLPGYFAYLLDHYAVDGIALDYVRSPSGADEWGYTGHARAAFREEQGIDPLEIDPLRDPLLQQTLDGWRERQVTALVAGVRGLVDRRRPSIRLAAAVFPNYYAAGGEHAIRQVTARNPGGVAVIPVLGFAAQTGPPGPPPAYPPIRSQIELAAPWAWPATPSSATTGSPPARSATPSCTEGARRNLFSRGASGGRMSRTCVSIRYAGQVSSDMRPGMNGYQRLLTILAGEIPDRMPLLHVWGHREGYHAGHLGAWARAHGLPAESDMTFLEYQRAHGHALGLAVEGWFSKLPKGDGEAAGGVHRYTQGGIRAGCDLRPFEDAGNQRALAEETIRKVELNRSYGLGTRGYVTNCFHALSGAMGLEHFCYALYDDRDWLEAAMDQAERYNRRGLEVMIRNGVDIVTIDGDIAYKTGTMISPQLLREIWFPRTRACVALLKDAGVKVMYHTDGKVDTVLPMLTEMGVDCFHGCEKMANNLADLKARFGRDITLIGNFDHAEMTFGTPDAIAATTRAMLAVGMPGGRYIADINTIVPAGAPVENYAAFIDTIRAEGVYR